jgi:hypothetical protein
MRFSLFVLLLLAGCCPSRIESLEGLRHEGGGPHTELLYDPDTDTLFWIDTMKWKIIAKYPHWNYHDGGCYDLHQ